MSSMTPEKLQQLLEAALMAYGKPMTIEKMQSLFEDDLKPTTTEIREALESVASACETRGVELKEVASGFRFQAKQEYAQWVSRLFEEKPPKYSRALLETMALIAYRQPITRSEIEEVRGVSVSSHIIKTLLEREWVRVVGHRDVPGRPALYATTKEFLDYFNLKSLQDLPSLSEIRDLDKINAELELEEKGLSPEEARRIVSESTESDDVEKENGENAENDSIENDRIDHDHSENENSSNTVDPIDAEASVETESDSQDNDDDQAEQGESSEADDQSFDSKVSDIAVSEEHDSLPSDETVEGDSTLDNDTNETVTSANGEHSNAVAHSHTIIEDELNALKASDMISKPDGELSDEEILEEVAMSSDDQLADEDTFNDAIEPEYHDEDDHSFEANDSQLKAIESSDDNDGDDTSEHETHTSETEAKVD